MEAYRLALKSLQTDVNRAFTSAHSVNPDDHPQLLKRIEGEVRKAFASFQREQRSTWDDKGSTVRGNAGEGAQRIIPVIARGLLSNMLKTASYRQTKPTTHYTQTEPVPF